MGTIMFDLFGVIARVQTPEALRTIERVAGTTDPDRFWTSYWRLRPQYDAGVVDGSQYWQAMAHDLGVGYHPAQIGDLIAADLASWDAVDPEMVAETAHLAEAGHRLALLSNIPAELAERYASRPWLDRFAVVGLSCRIGAVKPQPAAFAWVLSRLETAPGKVHLVDDAPANVAAARALGMPGHVFTGRMALRDYLRNELG